MNPNKKDYNSSWVLCDSRRFPGYSYHYNAVTREAVWNISDMERRQQHTSYVPDKYQSFPEPECPPVGPYRTYQPHRPYYQPTFGQVSFPKFGPNHEPMCAHQSAFSFNNRAIPTYDQPAWSGMAPNFGPKPYQFGPVKRENGNCNCNLFSSKTPTPDYQGFCNHYNQRNEVGNSQNYFSKRFGPYSDTQCNKPTFTKHQMPYNGNVFAPKPVFPTERPKSTYQNPFLPPDHKICNCMRANTQQNLQKPNNPNTRDSLNNDFGMNKLSFGTQSVESLTFSPTDQEETFNQPQNRFVFPETSKFPNLKKFHAAKLNVQKEKQIERSVKLNLDKKTLKPDLNTGSANMSLEETDLRLLLLSRRRKASANDQASYGKRIKTSYSTPVKKAVSPKKRVTFDLGVEEYSVDGDRPNADNLSPIPEEAVDTEPMDSASNLEGNTPCYVVVDLEALLMEFPLINEFVQSDGSYTLLIPQALKRELESLSAGLSNSSTLVLKARQILRKLAEPQPYIIVQLADSQEQSSELTDDPALMCCLQIIDDRSSVLLITDNEDLYNKATSLEVCCYSTQELKEFLSTPKPEVSFDLKKIENKVTNNDSLTKTCKNDGKISKGFPVNCTRKQLFGNTNDGFRDQQNEGTVNTEVRREIENLKLKYDEIAAAAYRPQNNFGNYRSEQSENIQKVNPFENGGGGSYFKNGEPDIDFRNYRSQELAKNGGQSRKVNPFQNGNVGSNFKNGEPDLRNASQELADRNQKINAFQQNGGDSNFKNGEPSIFFQNGCQVMEVTSTAGKRKSESVNMYNLNEKLRRFQVKNEDVERRIATRIDEWVCSFSQIMEVTLMDTLQSLCNTKPRLSCVAPCPPLRELLEGVRSLCSGHRTVTSLVDELCAALACGYKACLDEGRLSLCMEPSELMRMIGCGSLLVSCLRTIYPDCTELGEGETMLDQLLSDIEGGADIEPGTLLDIPKCHTNIVGETDKKRDCIFVKKPAEILQYLKKHFPNWNSSKTADNEEKLHEEQAKPAAKVVRTLGKKVGLVQLKTDKTMLMKQSNEKTAESNTNKKAKMEPQRENVNKNQKKSSGPKLLRKLALNSTNLPPKMKDIDVEKREAVNKQMLNMIDDIVGTGKVANANSECTKEITESKEEPTIVQILEKKSVKNLSNDNVTVGKENETAVTEMAKEIGGPQRKPKIVRKFENFTVKKLSADCKTLDKENKSANTATVKENSETKKPKIVRKFEKFSVKNLSNDCKLVDKETDSAVTKIVKENTDTQREQKDERKFENFTVKFFSNDYTSVDKENENAVINNTKELNDTQHGPKIIRTFGNFTVNKFTKSQNNTKMTEQNEILKTRDYMDLDALDYSDEIEESIVLGKQIDLDDGNAIDQTESVNDISVDGMSHDNDSNEEAPNIKVQSNKDEDKSLKEDDDKSPNEEKDNTPDEDDNKSLNEDEDYTPNEDQHEPPIKEDKLSIKDEDRSLKKEEDKSPFEDETKSPNADVGISPSEEEDENEADDTPKGGNDTTQTVDSAFYDGTLHSFIRMFFVEVTNTFNHVRTFIGTTIETLKKTMDNEKQDQMYTSVIKVRENIVYLIGNLKNIKERNANDALPPSLVVACDTAANDLLMRSYDELISKLLIQARLLRSSLRLLGKMIRRDFDDLTSSASSSVREVAA